MASNCIVSQCRRILCLSCNCSIWNKSQFYKSLESITDTKYQSVTLPKKFLNRLFHLRILECSCKEFRRTIRFITSAESTWEHDHLRLRDCFFKYIDRIYNIGSTHIAEYFYDCFCSCSLKSSLTVILTVCSREYRNKYSRLSDLVFADMYFFCIKKTCVNLLVLSLCFGICSKYAL